MFKKNKNKKPLIVEDDDDDFTIIQVYRPLEHIKKINSYKPSQVASPFFGTNVPDRQGFIDNSKKGDVDIDYDFVRRDEDKHLSKEKLIEKYGTEYYEFDLLDNEKAEKIVGEVKETETGEDVTIIENEVMLDKDTKAKPFLDMMSSIDDFSDSNDDIMSQEHDFDIPIEENDNMEYNQTYDKFDTPTPVNIPSFLTEEEDTKKQIKPKLNFEAKENTEEEIKNDDLDDEFVMPKYNTEEKEFSKDDLKKAEEALDEILGSENNKEEEKAEKEYSNPAVDRSLTIEEAMRLSNGGKTVPVKNDDIKPEIKPEVKEEKPVIKKEVKPEVKEKKQQSYKNYSVPYKKLFPKSEGGNDLHPVWLEEKKNIINKTLESFGIEGEVINYTKGPAFTLYEIMLAPGVNVKKVGQITDNLQMNLQVKSIRVLSPIPGKPTIGVEAPNDKADVVKFGDLLSDDYIKDESKPLKVALGKNIDGSPVFQDITSMPHALIAGATQSGKSVCINTILVSLLAKNSPENLKLILVDPKKVELTFYENIPHLATPVIDDPSEAAEALKWACAEMDRRYDVLARNRVRKISDYLEKRKQIPTMEPMPYIVIIVDEFNDLVMQCGQDVNDCIVRLAQKARAAGMHVILATQRPTVDVVNGTIKANIPCRIAFRVASSTDSSTILDETGAESLLGRGDMLIKNDNAPVRAQGAYISDDEIGSICDYLCSKYQPDYIFTHDDLRASISRSQSGQGGSAKDASGEDDELLFAIAEFCVAGNACSINAIQNNFGLGFNRAQRIVQLLEDRQIVSPKCGTKPREILVDDYKLREIFGVNE